MKQRIMMIPLLLAVIALAFTLPTWMAVIQASVAGFSLGAKFVMITADRDSARRRLLTRRDPRALT